MFDFDPRDQDRDDERWGSDHGRGSRGASDTRERDDEWLQPGHRGDLGDSRDHRWEDDSRDIRDDDWRDRDDDSRELGRGPGSDASRDSHSEEDPRNRYDDGRRNPVTRAQRSWPRLRGQSRVRSSRRWPGSTDGRCCKPVCQVLLMA